MSELITIEFQFCGENGERRKYLLGQALKCLKQRLGGYGKISDIKLANDLQEHYDNPKSWKAEVKPKPRPRTPKAKKEKTQTQISP